MSDTIETTRPAINKTEALAHGVDLNGALAYVATLDLEGLRSYAEAATYEVVRARRLLREARDSDTDPEIAEKVKEIVFGTRVAASIVIEDPATIVQVTARRIWDNLHSYFTVGDWPDRRRTAKELDAEEREARRD